MAHRTIRLSSLKKGVVTKPYLSVKIRKAMRTTILILVLVLVSTLMFGGNAIKGKSNTILGDYLLTPIGENLYQLSYSNGEASFTIEVCKDKKACCYLLRSDEVEVMYLCNELGFGMRRMPDKYKKIETSEYRQLINSETFGQQSLLTTTRKNESEALSLIACFFPLVIKNDAYQLVFNYNNKDDNELSVK
jgi:hypothetical protein